MLVISQKDRKPRVTSQPASWSETPSLAGIRAFHTDRDPGHVTGGLRDRPRLHLRHTQAPAHDHLRRWEGLDTGNEMTGLSPLPVM